MKKLYFLTSLFLCTFLTIGTNTVWGKTETITFTDNEWNPWISIISGSNFESSGSARGVANNKVNGSCKSPEPYNNITKIELVCSSNTTGGKVAVLVGTQNVGTQEIAKSNNTTYTYDVSGLSGVITIQVTAPSNKKTVWVKSISITTDVSKVSLVYNANGSTGGTVPPTGEYDKGTTVTVAGNTGGLVKTGFDFAGWNTLEDGSGTTYQGGSTFAINANTTLYALWTVQSNKLSTPNNLKTTDITSSGAKLSWDAVPHATKYIVTYAESNNPVITVDVTSTTYVLSDLLPNTYYIWTVKAVGDATYEDSEESSTAEFTTLPTPYTITWSTPNGTSTTEVTQGSAIGALPTDLPTSCSSTYANFVGWFTEAAGSESSPSPTKPATQVTAATVPTGNATYYAVFSDGTESKTTTLEYDTWTYSGTTTNKNDYRLFGDGSYVETEAFDLSILTEVKVTIGTFGGDRFNTISIEDANGNVWGTATASGTTLKAITADKTGDLTGNGKLRIKSKSGNGTGTGVRMSKIQYTTSAPATGYISSCCNDPAVVTVTPATTTINLDKSGKATTTVTCTQQNGGTSGTWSYSVSPSTATFDGTTFVATAAGEYTLTATYTESCGKSGMATITVTNTPVLYFPTTPADPIVFGTVECGSNTPLADKQTISLRGYNLKSDVTVTVTGDYKIAGTESAALADYVTSLTLPKDAVSGLSTSVYVISTPPMQSSSPTKGKVTFTTDGGNTLEVNLSTPTITCTEHTLTLSDRGTTTSAGNYLAGTDVPKPTDPTGVCTDPINYIFDGWATAEVAEGSTTYTKVSFPYTMPAANTTLYAVYRYVNGTGNDFKKVTTTAGVIDGEYLIVGNLYKVYCALSSTPNTIAGEYKAIVVTESANSITTEDTKLIWNIAKNGDEYTIEQDGNYLNISQGKLTLGTTAIPYTFSMGDDANAIFTTTATGNNKNVLLSYYAKYSVFNAYTSANIVYLYKRDVNYTTSPYCSPFITGTQDITVTSGKGIWVEAVTPLAISARNLDNNDDHAAVTITAESPSPAFTLKGLGTAGQGSASITLQTGYTQATLDSALTVVYKPTAPNLEENGQIVLRVSHADALATTYANETIMVRGRSLPEQFVLAAKTPDGSWVALPADLGTDSKSPLKSPYPIKVDETNNIANGVPETAIYSPANRSSVNAATTGIRFRSNKGGHLQASTAKESTNVWLSQQNSEKFQSWELHSTDLKDYSIRMQESEQGRYLSYSTDQGKIGNYKNGNKLRILPINNTCVRFDAPELNVSGMASTSVTLRWPIIAGANDYEYSIDGEKTYTACADITTITATDVEWTLSGLTPAQSYTLYIRAKVADGKTNCSASATTTFTTPTCDDVPANLRASVTANDVTITWNCTAATATVKIYSDVQGTKEVVSKDNVSSPCKFEGLTAGTTYYYQVLAGGTCASAIAKFTTETADINIVEWKKDAVTIDINTDVDNVSLVVEKQTSHGTTHNVADDLFFSKYYEATGDLKLLAIYNGTKDTLPLTNVKIQIGRTQWGNTVSMKEYGKHKTGYISPDEEIILWHKGTAALNECVAGQMDVTIMQEHNNISFSGKASIGLFRADTLIDIIGAGTKIKPKEGTTEPSWGDAPGWLGRGYDIENPTTEIQLSTNRCLLVRSNKVKSGRNAVLNDTTTFATLTKDEWLGRQVAKGTDNGFTESCNGFAYVADFNYNDYYVTYDSVGSLKELPGNRNPDGTFTIPILRLDTMACNNFRVLLKKDGAVVATKEQKIPIIVNTDANTQDPTYFGDKLTEEICKTCDVVVRDSAKLTHTAGGKSEFRDMYVYAGSQLEIPETTAMTLGAVYMFALNDNVSYAIINNTDGATTPAITIGDVVHIKRIDGHYWYPFSLPYNCKIADIRQINGLPLGTYGTDWGIKYYDGYKRQKDGNSTTHYGEVSQYWTMMPANGTLEAYKGYIIALFYPDENLMKSICFTPDGSSAYIENADTKTTHITNWPDNLTAEPRHHGWNFVGSPYISLFGSNNNTSGEGLYNTNVKMGYTDALGNQQDKDHIYVSIPNGGNTNTYTQALASGVVISPFSAYFVQAIDPTDGQSNTLDLRYSKTQRTMPTSAPARTANTNALILTELDITNGALGDNTGVLVSNVYSAEYEIGDDLTKMYAAAQKPQLYTIDAHNDKMAYQACPMCWHTLSH